MTNRWSCVRGAKQKTYEILINRVGPEPAHIAPGADDAMERCAIGFTKLPRRVIAGALRGGGGIANTGYGTAPVQRRSIRNLAATR